MNRTLVAIVDQDGNVEVFERLENLFWNRVDYKRVSVPVVRHKIEQAPSPRIKRVLKFVASQAVSILTSWVIG